jgi:Spy/CpxP family protein refolding chaperone
MGCGMMAGGTMGQGMMGQGMMERGMPRGRTMGPGMMGQGMGPDAMFDGLDLTEEQQAKLQKIRDELRDRHWESMGQIMKEGSRMRDLFAAPKMDRPALEAAHRRMSALREQMFMAQLDAHGQIEASLMPEKRIKLRQRMRGGAMMMH